MSKEKKAWVQGSVLLGGLLALGGAYTLIGNFQPLVVQAASVSPLNSSQLTTQLLSYQVSSSDSQTNGAILTGPAYQYQGLEVIEPYFNNLAVYDLLQNPNAAVESYAKNWLAWYVSNINLTDTQTGANGTVYHAAGSMSNHYYNPATQTISTLASGLSGTPDYDSADSYAATFMMALNAYVKATGDTAFVTNHQAAISLIANAAVATIDPETGLSNAKPSYLIEYLEDNCEVYAGLQATMNLLGSTSTAANGQSWQTLALGVQKGINTLYDPTTGLYKTSYGASAPDLSHFYPDAVSQLFPIIYGVISPTSTEAQSVITAFNSNVPGWDTLTLDSYPWLMVGQAEILTGNTTLVSTALSNYLSSQPANGAYQMAHEQAAAVLLLNALSASSASSSGSAANNSGSSAGISNAMSSAASGSSAANSAESSSSVLSSSALSSAVNSVSSQSAVSSTTSSISSYSSEPSLASSASVVSSSISSPSTASSTVSSALSPSAVSTTASSAVSQPLISGAVSSAFSSSSALSLANLISNPALVSSAQVLPDAGDTANVFQLMGLSLLG